MTWLQRQILERIAIARAKDISDDAYAESSLIPWTWTWKGVKMDLMSIANAIKEIEPTFDTALLLKINSAPLDLVQTGTAIRALFTLRGFPTFNYNTAGASNKKLKHRTLRYDFKDTGDFAKMVITLANVNIFSYTVTGGNGGNLRLHVPFDATTNIFMSSGNPLVWEQKYTQAVQRREAREVKRKRDRAAYWAERAAFYKAEKEAIEQEGAEVLALAEAARELLKQQKEKAAKELSLDGELKRSIRLEDE